MSHSLPLRDGPLNSLRHGFGLAADQRRPKHFVDKLQCEESEWNDKLDMVRRTYGAHLAMRLASERTLISRSLRMPGLEESNIALETVLGNDNKVSFGDFLNDKTLRPAANKIELHTVLEVKYGL